MVQDSKQQQTDTGPLDDFLSSQLSRQETNLLDARTARQVLMTVAKGLTQSEDPKGRDMAFNTVVQLDDLIEHLDGQS